MDFPAFTQEDPTREAGDFPLLGQMRKFAVFHDVNVGPLVVFPIAHNQIRSRNQGKPALPLKDLGSHPSTF